MNRPLDSYTDQELVAMPRPNVKLLDEVLDYIIDNPEEWDQRTWATRASSSPCGTTMCFAGHACKMAGDSLELVDDGSVRLNGQNGGWFDTAMNHLGLTYEEADDLFYGTLYRKDEDHLLTIDEFRLKNVKVEVERIRARAKAQEAAFNRIAQEFIDAAGLDDVVQPGYKCPESAEVLQGNKGGASE